jgi:hypothetical protein
MRVVSPEDRLRNIEGLITRTDATLAEAGFVIVAEGYEDYANALCAFLREGHLTSAQTLQLEGFGDIIRKVSQAIGAARGAKAGLKTRWQDFKDSVKSAYSTGHKTGYDKASGRSASSTPTAPAAPAASTASKRSRAGRSRRLGAPGARRAMSDKEYRARYGHGRSPKVDLRAVAEAIREMLGAAPSKE